MMTIIVVCQLGWQACKYQGFIPDSQCESMRTLALSDSPVMCIDWHGKVSRSPDFDDEPPKQASDRDR